MQQLVGALWPVDVPGNFTIWTNPNHISYHIPLKAVRSLTKSDLDELHQENQSNCVYYGLGLRRDGLPKTQRGGKNDIVAIPGFVIDIDTLDPENPDVHKAENLPETEEDVFRILSPFDEPSMVVETGHGYHVYWLFSEPLRLGIAAERQAAGAAFQRFQAPIIEHAKSLGFHVDKTDTIDRVWRIPGFNNVKSQKPVPVVLAELGTARYSFEHFDLQPKCETSSRKQEGESARSRTRSTEPRDPVNITKLRKILDRLAEPKHIEMFDAILAGKSFAASGERDAAMQSACSVIVYCAKGKGEPEELVEILKPSLAVWAAEPGAAKTLDEEITKAIDKLRRAQRDWDENEADAERQRQRTLDALGRKFFGKDYQSGDLAERHLIIQFRRSYFVFHFGREHYVGPHIKEELLAVVRDAFADTNFSTTYVNASGDVKQLQPVSLVDRYGTVAEHLQGSLVLQHSKFDEKTCTFYYATTPMRDLAPRFDPQIHEWLQIMGGPEIADPATGKTFADLMLDWVAGVSILDHQCAALGLIGDPGTGKSTLCSGLSRLWHEAGATKWKYSVGVSFNESIIQCPLIELSEGIDDMPKGTSSAFRDLIGAQEHVINPKGLSPYSVLGCVRVVLASNDDTVLSDIVGTRELSNASIRAIAERLCCIYVQDQAKDYLNNLKQSDPMIINRWINDGLIAQHSLWLRKHRQLPLE